MDEQLLTASPLGFETSCCPVSLSSEKVQARESNPRLGHHKPKGYHYPSPDTYSQITNWNKYTLRLAPEDFIPRRGDVGI